MASPRKSSAEYVPDAHYPPLVPPDSPRMAELFRRPPEPKSEPSDYVMYSGAPQMPPTCSPRLSPGSTPYTPNLLPTISVPDYAPMSRKRKHSGLSRDFDNDEEEPVAAEAIPGRRNSHSLIEKRRRDKLNLLIQELAQLIPVCSAMNRKLDKLTVLRMAVQHIKSLDTGNESSLKRFISKPQFLSDTEHRKLITQLADGFLMVVSCDRGRILFVSQSVRDVLGLSHKELIGQNLFDQLHPKDIPKVKEQLASVDSAPRERLIDIKTMMPVASEVQLPPQDRLLPGTRRSFQCRMKHEHSALATSIDRLAPGSSCNKTGLDYSEFASTNRKRKGKKNYRVVQCSGYIKTWPSAKLGGSEDTEEMSSDNLNLSCLVAVCRVREAITETENESPVTSVNLRKAMFMSRHTMEGRFIYVDPGITRVLGYLPQELIGSSLYELFHKEDIPYLSSVHKSVIQEGFKTVETRTYRMMHKGGGVRNVKTVAFGFINPWTKELDYISCRTTLLGKQASLTGEVSDSAPERSGCESDGTDQGRAGLLEMERREAARVGVSVAEEVQRMTSVRSPTLPNAPDLVTDLMHGLTPMPNSESGSSHSSGSVETEVSVSLARVGAAPHVGGRNGLTVSLPAPPAENSGALPNQHDSLTHNVGQSASYPDGRRSLEASRNNGITDSPLFSSDLLMPGTESDDVSMAMVMQMLEADAGLGSNIDLSDLPWAI